MHRKIDITKEGGIFLNALHQGLSPQQHSQGTPYQSDSREDTPELEDAAINLLELVDERVGRDSISTVELDSLASDTGQTLLQLSASLGFAQLLQELVTRGVNLDRQDPNGYSALHFAAFHGHIDCARSLIKGGADPSIINEHGCTPLETVAEADYRAISEILGAHVGAGIDVRGSGSGQEDKDSALLVPKPIYPRTFKSLPGNSTRAHPTLPPARVRKAFSFPGDETTAWRHARYSFAAPKEFSPAERTGDRIAWWLVPNAPGTEALENMIGEVAARSGGPTFHPHIPLFSLNISDKTVEELANITQTVVAEVNTPILLKEDGVWHDPVHHRSVCLHLKPTDALMALCANLRKALGAPAATVQPPHAPLYYGENLIGTNALTQMKNAVVGIGGLELTEVWIINIAAKNPANWKVLYKQALGTERVPFPFFPPLSSVSSPRRSWGWEDEEPYKHHLRSRALMSPITRRSVRGSTDDSSIPVGQIRKKPQGYVQDGK